MVPLGRRWCTTTLLFTCVVFFITGLPGYTKASVQCFVCSYSPGSNSTRVDGCTDTNFTTESYYQVLTRSCPLGCEAVTVYDLNGVLLTFHRNCATSSPPLTNTCETHQNRVLTRHVCTCDTSYCNAAPRSVHSTPSLLTLLLLMLVVGCLQLLKLPPAT
ncbi:hypothetical protein Pmani_027676 [Petrolisthes manimaculis]|uniref:Protein quiver n=1 Tax=Petrolisthes manimaculis TaxID=1843537 RepID=A0AAE1P317_9EUCA|nr:hypothetical protein Pmani_027676 [Petrolisthes manimaculis]